MFGQKLRPEDVFTPRAAEVNADMYVRRSGLETALADALRGNQHIFIHGESGSGKSWLYKKCFSDAKVAYAIANLANASRFKSINAELQNLVDREGQAAKVGYEEQKKADVSAGFASGGLSHAGSFTIGQKEPFEACLAMLRAKAGSRAAVLVFDNLEAVFEDADRLKELADLIILCDDERYSKYDVKIMIVGVPSGVKEYYYRTPHHATVANRITELPEVSRLTFDECNTLVHRGFVEKLGYNLVEPAAVLRYVGWVTDRLPQMVHEYCLAAARLAEGDRVLTPHHLEEAGRRWLGGSLIHLYAIVEQHMNERDTKAGRRNQTMYALAQCDGEQFKAPEVEAYVRSEFPTSTHNTTLNTPQVLSQLATGDRPLVKRSPKGDAYTFTDPRYRMVLRTMLRKTADERVEKLPVSR